MYIIPNHGACAILFKQKDPLNTMPELPEVETTKRGIAAYAKNTLIQQVIVHNPRLRWPVDLTRTKQLAGQIIHSVQRRGKYLLFFCDYLHFIIHLGMSGSLRMTQHDEHINL